jgi:hypothetical protein
MQRFVELPLGAQTAYAELLDQAQSLEMQRQIGHLTGSFHKKEIKGRVYWYFAYRDVDAKHHMVYVGPDNDRVRTLVDRFRQDKPASLDRQAKAAIALGCVAVMPRHYRIIKQLADYGFFMAGGLLIGTHAFIALGNLLGVRWGTGEKTLDIDFSRAGKRISLALPTDLHVDVHEAITSLEMGLLPISQFNGKTGAQFRNPSDPELRLDFVTPMTRADGLPPHMPNLNISLEPLKFLEFSLEDVTQGALIGKDGAIMVNLPSPARYAVHKLIVYGERPVRERVKSTKDLKQAACLAAYFLAHQPADFAAAWADAIGRGAGWRRRATEGREALLKLAPELNATELWGAM